MPMHVGWKPEGSYTYDALLVSSSDTRPSAPSTPSTVHYIYKKYYIRTKKYNLERPHTPPSPCADRVHMSGDYGFTHVHAQIVRHSHHTR